MFKIKNKLFQDLNVDILKESDRGRAVSTTIMPQRTTLDLEDWQMTPDIQSKVNKGYLTIIGRT